MELSAEDNLGVSLADLFLGSLGRVAAGEREVEKPVGMGDNAWLVWQTCLEMGGATAKMAVAVAFDDLKDKIPLGPDAMTTTGEATDLGGE